MQWNDHWKLEHQHAFLGASKYHWLRYDEEKLRRTFANHLKAQEGTELHDLAAVLIKKRVKLRGNHTLAAYVNDAIGYRMDPEVKLVFTEDVFGTADAIKYDHRKKELRIHDLKTGIHLGHMDQLRIYAVLFFLEYGAIFRIKPHDVKVILRIYQNDEVVEEEADPDMLVEYMEEARIKAAIVKEMKEATL